MTKKCIGCGSVLQTNDITKDGYVRENNYNLFKDFYEYNIMSLGG